MCGLQDSKVGILDMPMWLSGGVATNKGWQILERLMAIFLLLST